MGSEDHHGVTYFGAANEDYIPFDKTEVIGPQNLTRPYGDTGGFCTPFSLIDDIIVEGTESFFVVMTPISDRVKPYIPGEDRIEVHITDDDGKQRCVCVCVCVCPSIHLSVGLPA